MLNWQHTESLIAAALLEDIGTGDITTDLLVPESARGNLVIRTRAPMVVAGIEVAMRVFKALDADEVSTYKHQDGDRVGEGERLLTVSGAARVLLTGERTALNFLQRMCGVATYTHLFVEEVAGTGVKIMDTRKTMPGLRELDKYAAHCGGAANHRIGLFDAIMIKDNHLQIVGNIRDAVKKARNSSMLPCIVECDTLEQVEAAMQSSPNRILLDNMDVATLKKAVKLVGGKIPLEASGGVTLKNVKKIAKTGVNFISVGAITHSAPSADLTAEIELVK